jgi:ketosteroid isomerase-like protein
MSGPSFSSAEQAELAFYQAFEASDFNAMMAVWDDAADILCVHPMGPALVGRSVVADSWREIFVGGVAMHFSLEAIQIYTQDNLAIHIVNEHITIASGNPVAPMVATNIFRLTAHGWRMLTHHASPAPSAAMAQSHSQLH